MSEIKVNSIKGVSATSAAISINNTDGTCTANLSDFGRRNHVINGNFSISQRNGTTAYTGNGYGGPDRWYVNQSGATTSFQQVAFAMGEQRSGSQYYGKLTSSGNDFCWIEQRIEDVTKFNSQQITISFDAKYVSAKPSGGFNVRLVHNYGTGGSPSGSTEVYWGGSNSAESFVATTSWQRFQWNLTTSSLSGKTLGTTDNTSFVQLIIGQGSNTGNTAWELNIANVQIEYGAVASAFEQPRNKGDERALCQRYYQQYNNIMMVGYAPDNSNKSYSHAFTFPVEFRSAPTLTISNTGSSAGQYVTDGELTKNVTSLLSAACSTTFAEIYFNLSGDLTNYSGAYALSTTSTTHMTTYYITAEL